MKSIVLLVSVLLCVYSCKKSDPLELKTDSLATKINSQINASYFPMAVGNYWVYQEFWQTDSGYVSWGVTDSTTISKDTVINGNKYYKFEYYDNTNSPTIKYQGSSNYLRDSCSYIVQRDGLKILSLNNFTDTLRKGVKMLNDDIILYQYSIKMEKIKDKITVPAGTFDNVISARRTMIMSPTFSDNNNDIRYSCRYYSKTVGCIFENVNFGTNKNYMVRFLLRYNVAKQAN